MSNLPTLIGKVSIGPTRVSIWAADWSRYLPLWMRTVCYGSAGG